MVNKLVNGTRHDPWNVWNKGNQKCCWETPLVNNGGIFTPLALTPRFIRRVPPYRTFPLSVLRRGLVDWGPGDEVPFYRHSVHECGGRERLGRVITKRRRVSLDLKPDRTQRRTQNQTKQRSRNTGRVPHRVVGASVAETLPLIEPKDVVTLDTNRPRKTDTYSMWWREFPGFHMRCHTFPSVSYRVYQEQYTKRCNVQLSLDNYDSFSRLSDTCTTPTERDPSHPNLHHLPITHHSPYIIPKNEK